MMRPGKDFIGVGCGAFILNDKNEFLMLKRTDKCRNEAGKWNIPGGKVDFNEKVEEAILREIKEELGADLQIDDFMFFINHIIPDDGQHWVSFIFKSKIVAGELQNLEPHKHSEMKWFSLDSLPENLSISAQLMVNKIKNGVYVLR